MRTRRRRTTAGVACYRAAVCDMLARMPCVHHTRRVPPGAGNTHAPTPPRTPTYFGGVVSRSFRRRDSRRMTSASFAQAVHTMEQRLSHSLMRAWSADVGR